MIELLKGINQCELIFDSIIGPNVLEFIKNRNLGKQNYALINFKIEGSISLTNNSLDSNSEIQKIKENDLKLKSYYNLF